MSEGYSSGQANENDQGYTDTSCPPAASYPTLEDINNNDNNQGYQSGEYNPNNPPIQQPIMQQPHFQQPSYNTINPQNQFAPNQPHYQPPTCIHMLSLSFLVKTNKTYLKIQFRKMIIMITKHLVIKLMKIILIIQRRQKIKLKIIKKIIVTNF